MMVILAGSPDRALLIGRIGGGRALVVSLEGGGGCVYGSMVAGCVEGGGDIGGVDGSDVSSLITCTEFLVCGGDVLPNPLLFLVVMLRWDRSWCGNVFKYHLGNGVTTSNVELFWLLFTRRTLISPCRLDLLL